jgi:hypothetical protein
MLGLTPLSGLLSGLLSGNHVTLTDSSCAIERSKPVVSAKQFHPGWALGAISVAWVGEPGARV